jgi:benzoate-CoA ligase
MAQAAKKAAPDRLASKGTSLGDAEIPRDYNFAADILSRNLQAGRANKPVFVDSRGSWTYGQLAERVGRFGAALRARGIRREERVFLCMLDGIDWPTAFLGAIKAGVIPVAVNTLLTESDYEFMLTDSRARMLLVSQALLPKFAPLLARCPDLKTVIVSGGTGDEHEKFEDVVTGANPEDYTAPTTRDDMAFWLYSSGSTGKPKGTVHSQASLRLTDELYAAPILGITENDLCYSVAKLFFAYGLGNALTFPMSAGATTFLMEERPTPDGVSALLKKHPVTVFYGVPTFLRGFSRQRRRARARRGETPPLRLRRRGLAARCRPALPREIRLRHSRRHRLDRDAAHLPVQPARRREIRHHWKAYSGLRPQADRRQRGAGEAGARWESCSYRGPSAAIMYWNNRAQSRRTFMGEWTRSGDKYLEDADGLLRLLRAQ